LIVAVMFLAGRVISARRTPAPVKVETTRDPIEEILLRIVGSEIAPDVVNLVMFATAFDIIDNLVRLIESTDFIDKEKYFPQPAMERLKSFIADVHMKINRFKERFNIDEESRKTIHEIVESSILEYCTRTYKIEPPAVEETAREEGEEYKRRKTEMEFEEMFKEREKPTEKTEGIEKFLNEIVDIVESYGL